MSRKEVRLCAVTEQAAIQRLIDSQGLDANAAERLISGQLPRIRGLCRRMIRNEQVAAELSQEAVLRIYRSLPRFRGECAWKTWCFRITRNLCLNWLEKRREDLGEDGLRLVDPAADALHDHAQSQRQQGVAAAVDRVLDPVEARAVQLHYGQGVPIAQVTQALGLDNRSGARGVLQRARRKLRHDLRDQMPEDSIVQRWTARSIPDVRPMRAAAFTD